MKKPKEADTLRDCLMKCLKAHRIFAWRNNNAGVRRRDRNGREFWTFTGMKGVSDILGILPDGRFLAIETKSATGRLTPAQALFLDVIRGYGGLAIVARSPGELHDALTAEGF